MRIELEDQFVILQSDGENPFSNNEVIICFSPRGLGNANPTMVVADTKRGNSASVEVLVGGAVEVQ
ncbi:MAG: hypothetical protein U5L04_11000 [Trueperaceae bacterium]|nr:hypothetical protein [Trueperaceae bacterium]